MTVLERTPVTERETGKEPAKRWRNRWHSSVGWGPCSNCEGDHTIPGTDQWLGCLVHPTKQAAIENAEAQLRMRASEPTTAFVTYLGPVEAP